MNPFSIILIVVYSFIILRTKNKKDTFVQIIVVSTMCSIFIDAGYFIMLGEKEIDYGDFGLAIAFIWAIYMLFSGFGRKHAIHVGIAIVAGVIGILGLVFWPYREQIVTGNSVSYDSVALGVTSLNYAALNIGNLIKFAFLSIYYIVCLAAYKIIDDTRKDYMVRLMYGVVRFILFLGIIEWFFAYIMHGDAFRRFVNQFFGMGKQFAGLIIRNNSYMLQGCCREASHYLFGLFVGSIVLLLVYKRYHQKTALLWLFFLAFISIGASSLSAVFYIIGFFIFLIIYESKGKNDFITKKGKFIIGILAMVIMCTLFLFIVFLFFSGSGSYTLQRIIELPTKLKSLCSNISFSYVGENYSSETVRFFSIITTIKLIVKRPLFGFGIGTTICHSSTLQFIADVGLIGIASWYLIQRKFCNQRNRLYGMAICIYICINILSSVYLVPYMSVSTIVVMVAFERLCSNEQRKASYVLKG